MTTNYKYNIFKYYLNSNFYFVTIYIFPHVFRKEAVTRPEKDPNDVSYDTSPMKFQQTAFFSMVSCRREGANLVSSIYRKIKIS